MKIKHVNVLIIKTNIKTDIYLYTQDFGLVLCNGFVRSQSTFGLVL